MSEIIERMARAAYHSMPRNKPWEKLSKWDHTKALEAMRAALTAIREPTSDMLRADQPIEYTAPSGEMSIMIDVATKYGAWQVMIDQALATPTTSHKPPQQ